MSILNIYWKCFLQTMTHNLVYVLFFVSAYCFTLPTTTEPIGCGSGGGRTGNCTPRTFRSPRHHTKPAAQAMRETRHARYATSRSRTQAERHARHVISGTSGPAPGAVNWPSAQGTDAAWGTHRWRGVLTAGAGHRHPALARWRSGTNGRRGFKLWRGYWVYWQRGTPR